MVHPSQQKPPHRLPPLSLTIARRGRTRVLAISPWAAGGLLTIFVAAAAAVTGAAGYLAFHDELLGAAVSRQVEMQHAYEERIAALRSELDRMTSRHIVQSEGVEQQLGVLLDRQAILERRQSALDVLVDRARESGVDIAALEARLPRPRPDSEGTAPDGQSTDATAVQALGYMPAETGAAGDAAITGILAPSGPSGGPHPSVRTVLHQVQSALDQNQARQTMALDVLSASVGGEVTRLSDALMPIGIEVEEGAEKAEPQGGPFVPAAGLNFVERTAVLDQMLDDLQSLRRSASVMPLALPLTGQRVISSRFGFRIDPFLKRRAFHSGLDFVAAEGALAFATAPGIVVVANWTDGYGNMVEIRHAGGVTTRYGHLSKILVTPGTEVETGSPIGRVGSTGRSTGPHLHYETRRDGEAVNPAVFVAAGQALRRGE